jgi:hypothetical protein
MTCSRATSPAEEENDDSQQTKLVMDARSSRPSIPLTSTRAGAPSGLLRSEPSTARFKGKSQAIGARRLDMARPRPAGPSAPLVRTPTMLALAVPAP